MNTTETASSTTNVTVGAQAAPVAPAQAKASKATKPAKKATAATPAKAKKTAKSPKPKPAANKKAVSKPASKKVAAAPGTSKKGIVIDMLRTRTGATMAEIMKATDWQTHTVRGFISGMVTKKMGLKVESTRSDSGQRTYRITGK